MNYAVDAGAAAANAQVPAAKYSRINSAAAGAMQRMKQGRHRPYRAVKGPRSLMKTVLRGVPSA